MPQTITTSNNLKKNIMKLLKQSLFTDKYSRKEGESRIYNLIILDESGSMGPIREQTISGANEVLHTILKAQQENPDDNQMISVVTFDNWGNRDTVRAIINCMKIEEVSNLTYKDYNPDGLTPLYDAIGHSLTDLNKLVQKEDNVLVTIITDGMENASKDYSAEGIRNLIKELTDMGWVFTFIGANQDSILSARQLNIRSAMDFETTGTGAQIMFSRMGAGMGGFFKKVRHNKKNKEKIDLNHDFFSSEQARMRVTPDNITELKANQVFVFGSNVYGLHNGGAAKYAKEHFGAIFGQCRGLQGQSYAIPTTDQSLKSIADDVDDFIQFADRHPELTFLVTRIGCGHAGFSAHDIAPLFARAYGLPNVFLPAEFWEILTYRYPKH